MRIMSDFHVSEVVDNFEEVRPLGTEASYVRP